MTSIVDLQDEVAKARGTIRLLQQELIETNREVMALTLDLEQRVDERTAELRRRESELRAITENVPALVSYLDADGVYRFVNRGYEEWFDVPRSQIVGRHYRDVLGAAVGDALKQRIADALAGRRVHFEENLPYVGAGTRWVSADYVPDADDEGAIRGFLALVTDITDRKRAEQELWAYSQRLEEMVETRTGELQVSNRRTADALALNETIIAASSVGIMAFRVSGECILANASMGEILGISRDELLTRNLWEISTWREAGLLATAETALDTGQQARQDARVVTASGREIWVESRFVPFRLQDEVHLLVLMGDITKRVELQAQLVRQEKLATLGRLAGSISHELRNPLGSVHNAAYFLDMALENPEPDVREALGIMKAEIDRAENIIVSLLAYARSAPPARQHISLEDVVRRVLDRLCIPESIDVVLLFDDNLPMVYADGGQMEQIFHNLLLNAIQAMPEGGQLTVEVKSSGRGLADPGELTVAVTDTGTGITAEGLDRVFEPLYTTKVTGIGLGLPIVKMFVEGHGGTITVASGADQGTTFTLKLPLTEATTCVPSSASMMRPDAI